nr:KilA-N domain-containing protein [uncultured Pseudomonas sp.]
MSILTALHHKQITVAIDAEGMLNATLLAKQFGRNPIEFIMLDGNQLTIAQVAERNGHPLRDQWQNNQVRLRNKPEYLRALTTARIIRHAAGTPGGHVAAAPNTGGNGIYNYDAGLWVHPSLAVGLARWLECRGEDWKPSPLAEFVEQALAGRGTGKPSQVESAAPKSAADSFSDMVDAQTLTNLRQMDQLLIDGGLPFSERHQTLQARLDQHAKQGG